MQTTRVRLFTLTAAIGMTVVGWGWAGPASAITVPDNTIVVLLGVGGTAPPTVDTTQAEPSTLTPDTVGTLTFAPDADMTGFIPIRVVGQVTVQTSQGVKTVIGVRPITPVVWPKINNDVPVGSDTTDDPTVFPNGGTLTPPALPEISNLFPAPVISDLRVMPTTGTVVATIDGVQYKYPRGTTAEEIIADRSNH